MRPVRGSRFAPLLAALALAGLSAAAARAELLVGNVRPSGASGAAFDVGAYGDGEDAPAWAPTIPPEDLSLHAAAALVLFVGQLPPPIPRDPTTTQPGLPPVIDITPQIGPSHAPEPATLISGLIGTGLAGFFTLYRRRKGRAG